MRSGPQEQLVAWSVGVSGRPFRVTSGVHLATLRRFDKKPGSMVKNGPLIPWERRLPIMEISENQEVNYGHRFGNRDYDRPYGYFMVTLRRFD